jgi:hypothetical protein
MILVGSSGLRKAYTSVLSAKGSFAINGASLCEEANAGTVVFTNITINKNAAEIFLFMFIFLVLKIASTIFNGSLKYFSYPGNTVVENFKKIAVAFIANKAVA